MGAKRALIVDDSRSARLFLARTLEQYDIDVDSAESAEAAIEYLGSHRPDVIFMDHLMPGMDGFEAVRAIKNDPRTATIPIMMYTSEEGELYLGEARALGALGVLPKEIRATDVSKVLHQLHLVPEPRSPAPAAPPAEPPPAEAPRLGEAQPPAPAPPAATAAALAERALREQIAELRHALLASIDAHSERIRAEVRALIEAQPAPPAPAPRRSPPWAWIVACAALVAALAGSVLWWRSVKLIDALTVELTQVRAASAAAAARGIAQPGGGVQGAGPGVLDLKPLVMAVPYGADPLAGPRLEAIRQLLARLASDKSAHQVEVRTFAGRFCLVGNAMDGYSLPPDEMPFARCDLIGNPPAEALAPAQRMPLALANLIAATRSASGGALDVEISPGDAGGLLVPYPTVAGDISAGDWNRAGAANNRVEIRVR
jgi:CheY-like chemotaxis protein